MCGGGGGGTDGVYDEDVYPKTPTVKHLIMGAVSLCTRLPALYLCTGLQKVYPASELSRPTAGPHRCMSTLTSTTAQELHLRHLSLHDGHDHHVPDLQLWDPTEFCILNHPASVVAHTRACQQTRSSFNELQQWDLDCLLTAYIRGIWWTCTTRTWNTLSMDCNW